MLFPCELIDEMAQVLAGHTLLPGSARNAPESCVSWAIPTDDVPGLRCWELLLGVLLWQVCFVSQQAFSWHLLGESSKQQTSVV